VESEQVSPQSAVGRNRKQSKKRTGRRRIAPQRTCVGCRTVDSKRAMVRVVRTPDNTVEIDPSGKRAGRGAYLCQQRSCWQTALKRRSLERALKTTLDDPAKAALTEYMQSLPENAEISPPVSGSENH
jgi:predicted RNA-binding protein YlxR (DUF448 family)